MILFMIKENHQIGGFLMDNNGNSSFDPNFPPQTPPSYSGGTGSANFQPNTDQNNPYGSYQQPPGNYSYQNPNAPYGTGGYPVNPNNPYDSGGYSSQVPPNDFNAYNQGGYPPPVQGYYNGGYPPNPYNPGYNPYYAGTYPGKGQATASLVCGILSLVFIWRYYYIAVILAIVGIVMGVISKKKSREAGLLPKGSATGGLVCSIIALVIGIVLIAIAIFLVLSGQAWVYYNYS